MPASTFARQAASLREQSNRASPATLRARPATTISRAEVRADSRGRTRHTTAVVASTPTAANWKPAIITAGWAASMAASPLM
jgi:hypothetical protein